jgi:hypothetical protein
MGWTIGVGGSIPGGGWAGIFLFSTVSTPALEPTQPAVTLSLSNTDPLRGVSCIISYEFELRSTIFHEFLEDFVTSHFKLKMYTN